MRRSACLQGLIPSSDTALTDAYYFEMLACLSASKSVDESIEILDEFSDEVLLDLELKDLCFRSREVFVNGHMICHRAFTQPSGLSLAVNAANSSTSVSVKKSFKNELVPSGISFTSSAAHDVTAFSSDPKSVGRTSRSNSKVDIHSLGDRNAGNMSDSEYQIRLQAIALDRLRLIRSVLKTFSCILFCSESISSRFGILAGPAPLDLQSWMALLVPNVYARLCDKLGCAVSPDHIEISAEIDKSLSMARQYVDGHGHGRGHAYRDDGRRGHAERKEESKAKHEKIASKHLGRARGHR